MEFKIGENYMVTTDKYNHILHQKQIVNKRDGSTETSFKEIGYFGKLEHALHRLLKEELTSLDKTNIQMIIDCIRSTEKMITKAVEGLNLRELRGEE